MNRTVSESGETIGEVADGRYLKNFKIAIFPKRFKLSRRNLARWLLTPSKVEKGEFLAIQDGGQPYFYSQTRKPRKGADGHRRQHARLR